MTPNEQAGPQLPPPGWYLLPGAGAYGYWDGQAWVAQRPVQQPVPQPVDVARAGLGGWPAPPAGAGTQVLARSTTLVPTAGSGRRPGSGPRPVVWLAGAVVLVAVAAGAFFVLGGHGGSPVAQTTSSAPPSAPPSAPAVQHTLTAGDATVRSAMRTAAIDLETWFTDHQTYVMDTNPGAPLDPAAHVTAKVGEQGYCLRGYATGSAATGPAGNGKYWWYDSLAGGVQPVPAAVSPTAAAPTAVETTTACAMKGTFAPLPG